MSLRDLVEGMRGEDVRAVQKGLNEYFHGTRPPLDPDGNFGTRTRAAVEAFQLANPGTGRPDGKPDGVVGGRTLRKLFPLAVVTATVIGYKVGPAGRPSLHDRIVKSFSPGQLRLDGPTPAVPATPAAPVPGPAAFSRLLLGDLLVPIKIPRLVQPISAPLAPQLTLPKWKYDHAEVVPGGQTTFPFSGKRQDALSLTIQSVFSRGPSEGAHIELTPGVTFGVPLNAKDGDGSAWTFNPFIQITDVDRPGSLLHGRFHLWQPFAQAGFQGSFARDVNPTLTLGVTPFNLGFDATKFLTLTFGAGFVSTLNLETGAFLFGGQFTLGANLKFGAPPDH